MAGGANILSVRTRALPVAGYTPATFGEVVTTSMASMARQLPNTFVNTNDEFDAENTRKDMLSQRFGQDYISKIESEIEMEPPSLVPFFGDSAEDRVKQRQAAINARIDADIEAGRKATPDTWQGIQTTEELRQLQRSRAITSREMADDFARRAGSPVAAFAGQAIGAIGGAFTDPFNLATLPFGAISGMRALTAIGTEAAANAAIEALQTPSYVAWQKELGVDLTAGDIAVNILTAGAGGAAFSGIMRGLGAGIRYAGSKSMPILERMSGNKALPAEVREGALNLSRARHVDENAPDLLTTTNLSESLARNRAALQEAVDAFSAYRQPVFEPRISDLAEFSFRNTGRLSHDNIRRLSQRSDQKTAIIEQARFSSRADADRFIRQHAKETSGYRTDYYIERSEAGEVVVLKSTDGIFLQKDELGNVVEYQSNQAAKSAAKGIGGEAQALSLNPKEGKAAQRHLVVIGASADDIARIKANQDFVSFFDPEARYSSGDAANQLSPMESLRVALIRSPKAPPQYDVSPIYMRPNNALQSLRMETEAMDYQSVQPAFDADFERLVRDMPDMEIVNADGTVTSVKEIKADIAERQAELQALRVCGVGKA